MSVKYFDSSVILSMLLNDTLANEALKLWESASTKLSSRLLCLECQVASHRCALKFPKAMRANWYRDSAGWLSKVFNQIYIHEIDASIQHTIKQEHSLGQCRSLDAIHLATCILFLREDPHFELVTFDQKMTAAAKSLGIPCN